MATLPITSVPIDNDEYYEFTNGLLVIDIDNTEGVFTETMDRYLTAIVFQVYTKVDEEYIPVKNVSTIWNNNIDEAITLNNIPDGAYATIKPVVDKSVLILKDRDGNLLYPDAKDITEFPITISII